MLYRACAGVQLFLLGAVGCGTNATPLDAAASTDGGRDAAIFDASGPSSTMLFASGFEQGVSIASPVAPGGAWIQFLQGADATGFNWTDGLPDVRVDGQSYSRFQYIVDSGLVLTDYAETRIDDVAGFDGSPTRALFMAVRGDGPMDPGATRNQFNFYWDPTRVQAYARYRLRLQENLEVLMPTTGDGWWKNFMEWQDQNHFRWTLNILRNRYRHDGRLFWQMYGEITRPTRQTIWVLENDSLDVPIGEWFLLEIFWRQSTGDDGLVWVKVNGHKLFEMAGANKPTDAPWSHWNPFKVYTGSIALGEAHQWIDDVEIHSDVPADR